MTAILPISCVHEAETTFCAPSSSPWYDGGMLCVSLPQAQVAAPLGLPQLPQLPLLPPLSENALSALFFAGTLTAVTAVVLSLAAITSAVDRRRKGKKALGMSDDTWPASAHRTLRETEEEIDIFERSIPEWEQRYRSRWPGASYAKVMRGQQHHLRRQLKLGPPGQLSLKF